jgi:group I intron endonuclease
MMYLYLIRNKINGKVYVGQTKNFVKRKINHVNAARSGSEYPLYRSMRKHGIENFEFSILEECSDELVNDREKHWVSQYDSYIAEKGYNLTRGGSCKPENETLRNLKLSERFSGAGNPMYGVDRHGEKSAFWGKHHTDDTRRRISEAQRGDKGPMYGRCGTLSPTYGMRGEQCANAKLTQAQADEIRAHLKQKTFPSLKALGVQYGVSRYTVSRIRDGEIYI